MNSHMVRILAADADRATAENVADCLRYDGHEVRAVYDAQTAVDTARTFRPHIVIFLDIPARDRYQAAMALRRPETATQHVILIAQTYRDSADVQGARQPGFDHYLVTPAEHGELSALVLMALSGPLC